MKADSEDVRKELEFRITLMIDTMNKLKEAARYNNLDSFEASLISTIDILENIPKETHKDYSDMKNDPEISNKLPLYEYGYRMGELHSINKVIDLLVNDLGYGTDSRLVRRIKDLKNDI